MLGIETRSKKLMGFQDQDPGADSRMFHEESSNKPMLIANPTRNVTPAHKQNPRVLDSTRGGYEGSCRDRKRGTTCRENLGSINPLSRFVKNELSDS